MNVSILSLRWLSDPVRMLSASVSMQVVRKITLWGLCGCIIDMSIEFIEVFQPSENSIHPSSFARNVSIQMGTNSVLDDDEQYYF